MKHRNLNRSTCHLAGREEPQPAKSKKGGGYPHKQPFNDTLRYSTGKKGKKNV